jgi:sulfite reductase (NADPH) flavoprotein alpha-component
MSLPEDPLRLIAAALLASAWIVWVWRVQHGSADGTRGTGGAVGGGSGGAGRRGPGESAAKTANVLVAFASQTGVATTLARSAADRLRAGGLHVRLEALGKLELDDLLGAGRALFLVSTCGEGDAPDEAFGFVRRMSLAGPRLEPLDFAVLALGDRKYSNFCAFGRRLESWLLERGARPLAGRIDVDGDDQAALGRWENEVLRLAGAGAGAAPVTEQTLPSVGFAPWRLVDRVTMNPGSAGEPILRLRLEPVLSTEGGAAELPVWEPGDLVQIEVPGEPPVLRDYSIASLAEDGRIELFVRLQRREDGGLGVASKWLSGSSPSVLSSSSPLISGPSSFGPASLSLGETLRLRLRENRGFRLVAEPGAPLILIGTGSGLAGLVALIKARERAQAQRNWLIFGDRNRSHDFLCREEIERWQASGVLERFDAAFSRDGADGGERRYVQHCMHEQAETLREWVRDGAAIHVCGSRERVGQAVDVTLVQILGDDEYALLRESGRYRRDVW